NGLIENGARRDGAHRDHDLGSQRGQLGREEGLAAPRFARQRAAVAGSCAAGREVGGWPALHGIGEVEEVLEVETETLDLAAHEHSARARPLPSVLDAGDAWSLADQDEPGITPAEGARRELPPGAQRRAGATRRDAPEHWREGRR